jgi:hypothetical protein
MVAIIVIILCMIISNNARNRTHRNTESRLELTRKRYEMCDTERRILNGEKISAADEIQMAQDEYSALRSENDLLKEDNNDLSYDISELERFVDDLRDEMDEKDFISDDEAEALEETLALGNNSATLKELVEVSKWSEVDDIVVGKDELIGLLLSEMKLKRANLVKCMTEKKVVGKTPLQFMWADMSQEQKNALLRAQVKKIAGLNLNGQEQAAEDLMKIWAPRHYNGETGLRQDVEARMKKKRASMKEGQKQFGLDNVAYDDRDEEWMEDWEDEQWSEWDWDDEHVQN